MLRVFDCKLRAACVAVFFLIAMINFVACSTRVTRDAAVVHPSRANTTIRVNGRQATRGFRATAVADLCQFKDVLMSMNHRFGLLDDDMRNRLTGIENKMVQFEGNNLARLDSIAIQQKDFLKRLQNMEQLERLTKLEVENLKGDFVEGGHEKENVVKRNTAELNMLPDMFVNETKLESLAHLLMSTRVAVAQLENKLDRELKYISQQMQRRFNALQNDNRRRFQAGQSSFYHPVVNEGKPLITSCAEGAPTAADGILKVQLSADSKPFYVQCEDSIDGGGWIVIQNRYNGDENFSRDWLEYKNGFGNLAGEFFIGLEKLNALTSSAVQELMIQLQDFEGQQRYAKYSAFAIGDEEDLYPITILGDYEGDAGDSFSYHAGSKFSTFDKDNDGCPECNCAQARQAGWWFNWCDMNNLNGIYMKENFNRTQIYQGIYWHTFHGPNYSMKGVRMLIRPADSMREAGQSYK